MHLQPCSLKVYYVSKHINNFDGISALELQFCTLQILDDWKENYMEYREKKNIEMKILSNKTMT